MSASNNNPLSGRPGGSPFSRGNAPKPPTPTPPPSRFGGGFLRRAPDVPNPDWTIKPLYGTAVRFDLKGMGDFFHRLLGTPLQSDYGDLERAIEALQTHSDWQERLTQLLDEAWAEYRLRGACLMYPYEVEVRRAFADKVKPFDAPAEPEKSDSKDDSDDEEYEEDQPATTPEASTVMRWRSLDVVLVLNVLARTRSHVLVANTPLVFEPRFLTDTLICDDPRLVALVKATGYIEEAWS